MKTKIRYAILAILSFFVMLDYVKLRLTVWDLEDLMREQYAWDCVVTHRINVLGESFKALGLPIKKTNLVE